MDSPGKEHRCVVDRWICNRPGHCSFTYAAGGYVDHGFAVFII